MTSNTLLYCLYTNYPWYCLAQEKASSYQLREKFPLNVPNNYRPTFFELQQNAIISSIERNYTDFYDLASVARFFGLRSLFTTCARFTLFHFFVLLFTSSVTAVPASKFYQFAKFAKNSNLNDSTVWD